MSEHHTEHECYITYNKEQKYPMRSAKQKKLYSIINGIFYSLQQLYHHEGFLQVNRLNK